MAGLKRRQDSGMSLEMRACTNCGEAKPASLEHFHVHKAGKGGLRSTCKECRRVESRANYLVKGDRIRETSKAWQVANQLRANANKIAWAKRNHEFERQRKREYRALPSTRAREAQLRRERERLDICFRLRRLMSRRMWMSLRHAKDGWAWEQLVGFTRLELMVHLERQFTPGMTWERFANGEIHIDHIIPVAVFSYTSPHDPEFKACWGLGNLRPMWASDNCSKGAKVLTLL